MRIGSIVAVAFAVGGCAGAPAPPRLLAPPTDDARARLTALRARADAPATRHIAIEIHEPRTGKTLSARGAVAVQPPTALRMILLGPGGTTALDLWTSGSRYRFAVPAIDLDKRGDLTGPREERGGLPVDFLASWLLHPARGELVGYARGEGIDTFQLRDASAFVTVSVREDGSIEERRETWITAPGKSPERIDDETIRAGGLGCARASYHQGSTGLDVAITCEQETLGPPAPRALEAP